MSRESLHARLTQIEDQLAVRLIAEIQQEARGSSSMFLLRRMSPYFGGQCYRSKTVEELERLYEELLGLEAKLDAPLSEGPAAILHSYEHLVPSGAFPAREKRLQFARAQLAALQAYMRSLEGRVRS